MHLNKTKLILVVMLISTLVLGATALFIGWKLQQQQQVNVPTNATGCTCPPGYQGPDQYNKCWSESNPGATVTADCGPGGNTASSTPAGQSCTDEGACTSYCCVVGGGGCNQKCQGGKLVDVNGGPGTCPNGANVGGADAKAGNCPVPVGCVPACPSGKVCNNLTHQCVDGASTLDACKAAGGCWNTTDGACTLPNDTWCGPGGCVPGRNDLCQYKCVGGSGGNLGTVVNTQVACQAGSCQAGYCLNIKAGDARFGECVPGSSATNPNCNPSINTGTCKVCDCGNACDYNGGSECRSNCTIVPCAQVTGAPKCGQVDYNCGAGQDCGGENINTCSNCGGSSTTTTTTTTTSSTTVSSATPSDVKTKIGGRVYCQDTGGQPVPISGAVVAVNVAGTTVNATTDSDGFYVSSDFDLPVSGVDIGVDVSSLPSTFNNGLNTSQLESKSAINCSNQSVLNGCTEGVAPEYYCSSDETSYENCLIKSQPSDPDKGYGGFNIKYTNCSSATAQCGDSTVDAGEQCDPVGSVGQCSNGGKCLNGCVCPTCNSNCTENDDCQNGFVCSNGMCRNPSCDTASDCSCRTIPGTAFFSDSRVSIIFAIALILFGVMLLRSNSFMLKALPLVISVAGPGVLKYVDPDVAKKIYEKNILEKEE